MRLLKNILFLYMSVEYPVKNIWNKRVFQHLLIDGALLIPSEIVNVCDISNLFSNIEVCSKIYFEIWNDLNIEWGVRQTKREYPIAWGLVTSIIRNKESTIFPRQIKHKVFMQILLKQILSQSRLFMDPPKY